MSYNFKVFKVDYTYHFTVTKNGNNYGIKRRHITTSSGVSTYVDKTFQERTDITISLAGIGIGFGCSALSLPKTIPDNKTDKYVKNNNENIHAKFAGNYTLHSGIVGMTYRDLSVGFELLLWQNHSKQETNAQWRTW